MSQQSGLSHSVESVMLKLQQLENRARELEGALHESQLAMGNEKEKATQAKLQYVKDCTKQMEELHAKLTEACARNHLLEKSFADTKEGKALAEASLKSIQRELDDCQKQRQAAEQTIFHLNKQKSEDAERIKKLEAQLQEKTGVIEDLNRMAVNFRHALKGKEEQLASETKAKHKAEQEVGKTVQQLSSGVRYIQQLKDDLKESQTARKDLAADVEVLREELRKAEKVNAEKAAAHEKELQAVKRHLQQTKKQLKGSEAEHRTLAADVEVLQKKLQESETSNSEKALAHEKMLQQLLVAQGRLESLKKELKENEAAQWSLIADVELLQGKLQTAEKANAERTEAHEKEVQDNRHCYEVLYRQLLKSEMDRKTVAQEMEVLKAKLKDAEKSGHSVPTPQVTNVMDTRIGPVLEAKEVLSDICNILHHWGQTNEGRGQDCTDRLRFQVEQQDLAQQHKKLDKRQTKVNTEALAFLIKVCELRTQIIQRQHHMVPVTQSTNSTQSADFTTTNVPGNLVCKVEDTKPQPSMPSFKKRKRSTTFHH